MNDVHKKQAACDSYEEMFIVFADSVEKWLVRGIGLLLVLFLISQLLLQFPAVRALITPVEAKEGVPFEIR